MRVLLIGLVMLVSGRCFAESGCFKSVGEAARATGVRDEGGFRVEGVRRDPLSGVEWVRVARCGRPEVPWVLVRGVLVTAAQIRSGNEDRGTTAKAIRQPQIPSGSDKQKGVVAGDVVRVIWEEGAVRGELAGVSVVSGVVGARVRVRVENFAKTAEERFVAGVVKAAGLVELEVGR